MLDLIESLKSAYRSGRYAAPCLERLTDDAPVEALEWAARLRLDQGDLTATVPLYEKALSRTDDIHEKQVLQMQLVSLRAQASGNLDGALKAAAEIASSGPVPSPILRLYHLRIEILAGAVRLISQDGPRAALKSLVPELEDTSPFYAALAQRWLCTSAQSVEERISCARQGEVFAERSGFPHLAADAWITVAQSARQVLAPLETVSDAIEHAEKWFAKADHEPGLLSTERERIMMGLLTGEAQLANLQSLAEHMESLGARSLLVGLQSDLATLFRERGYAAEASHYQSHATRIAAEVGIGNYFRVDALDEIETLRGSGQPVAAIKASDELLSTDTSDVVRGMVLQAKARCHADLGAPAKAHEISQTAAEVFRSIEADEFLSILASEQAQYLEDGVASRLAFEKSDRLLAETAAKDAEAERRPRVLQSAVHHAQLSVHAFNAFRDPADLDEAEKRASAAAKLSDGLPKVVSRLHEASCLQVVAQVHAARAQYAANRGDSESADQHLGKFRVANKEALRLTLKFDRRPTAAGCALMGGIVEFNVANDVWRSFNETGPDEKSKRQALWEARKQACRSGYDFLAQAAELYADCGQATLAARARLFQAETAANAAMGPALGSPEDLVGIAWRHIEEADSLYEARRAELELQSPNETLAARQELSKSTERLTALALRILVMQAPDLPRFWEWLQKAKSRSISDALASRREGSTPITFVDAQTAMGIAKRPIALIDWCVTAGQVYLIVVGEGAQPLVERLAVQETELLDRIAVLTERNYRATLASTPELLNFFEVLVAPLSWMTSPETLLVLSPMSGIGALPLHALRVNGAPLITRNPLIMVPNHAVGLEAQDTSEPTIDAAVFGDPTSDLTRGSEVLNTLKDRLATPAVTGDDVTADKIGDALASARLLHYHGHAWHDPNDPLASALDLAGGPMRAADVIAGPPSPTELAVLGACESGAARILRGHEANGLTQAFLLRGVARVISTLWTTPESAANVYVDAFYRKLRDANPIDGHRSAVCAAIEAFGEQRPDLWAPFILSGRVQLKGENS